MRNNDLNDLVDEETYSRFDERDTVFSRIGNDEGAPFYQTSIYDSIDEVLDESAGYSTFDLARALGGWAVYDYFPEAFEAERSGWTNNIMNKPDLDPPTKDPKRLAVEVKSAALSYGAHSIGITDVDPRWIYSRSRSGNPVSEPLTYNSVIVITVPVDYKSVKSSPDFCAARASAVSYSRMAFMLACMAEFIRRLGYEALPMGNDHALSIPLAVQAGLGQLGRNGLLLTPEYGSCIKICKVFTDMKLQTDSSFTPPLSERCFYCRICTNSCEAGAISDEPDPIKETVSPSNNVGITRWPVNHDKCYQFWVENGSDCSTCISSCPLTP